MVPLELELLDELDELELLDVPELELDEPPPDEELPPPLKHET